MGAGTHTNTCNTLRAVKRATAPHGRAKALGIGWVACLTTTGVTTDAPNTSGNLMTRKQQPEPNQATGNGTPVVSGLKPVGNCIHVNRNSNTTQNFGAQLERGPSKAPHALLLRASITCTANGPVGTTVQRLCPQPDSTLAVMTAVQHAAANTSGTGAQSGTTCTKGANLL
eukprot:CAMPEP_0174373022 /NCGR_PEP_ID=MMETSP0811_2-20130205/105546_1 /TAXON_ID=73025 ORGANISM="Eutreptiella gymnastica-like, Strain CCMP1594" /NCGR_SAMPLE_ID=MMETSP0811_2 /ASSEMBLY_ACC=CAM_ASM_000667 /LENGTH=170 /DNA_ID=CAMNT_0015520945 /DNA_START=1911 /DNA_END=2421 /DNA_ORIENTATION=-